MTNLKKYNELIERKTELGMAMSIAKIDMMKARNEINRLEKVKESAQVEVDKLSPEIEKIEAEILQMNEELGQLDGEKHGITFKINFFIRTNRFTGFEFSTSEGIYVEEYGDERNLFRFDKFEDGTMCVSIANSEEYCIHEDASSLFDFDALNKMCFEQIDNLHNHTVEFLEYCEEEFGEYDDYAV